MLLIDQNDLAENNTARNVNDDLRANAAIVASYVTAKISLDAKRDRALKAALAIRAVLWRHDETTGKVSGKVGRKYRPEVAAMLEAAYPMPDNATDKQRTAVKVSRTKMYQIIDSTTADSIGKRADRSPSHARKMGKSAKGIGSGMRLAGADAGDVFSALDAQWRKADREYTQIATHVAALTRFVERNSAALDAIAHLIDLVSDRPAFNTLGQLVCDTAIEAGSDVDADTETVDA